MKLNVSKGAWLLWAPSICCTHTTNSVVAPGPRDNHFLSFLSSPSHQPWSCPAGKWQRLPEWKIGGRDRSLASSCRTLQWNITGPTDKDADETSYISFRFFFLSLVGAWGKGEWEQKGCNILCLLTMVWEASILGFGVSL